MIPKKLWFIWLGDNKPSYVDFTINVFKKVNPSFDVELIHKTVHDIENPIGTKYESEITECINYILDRDNPDKNVLYKKSIMEYINSKRRFIQILTNIFRLKIINKYGGIYLDCDTFPIKPFDDEILNNVSFSCHIVNGDWKRDCFFLGCVPGIYREDFRFNKTYDICLRSENKLFVERKKLFFDCKLPYIEDLKSNYYIDHFEHRTWQSKHWRGIATPVCKYDKELYKNSNSMNVIYACNDNDICLKMFKYSVETLFKYNKECYVYILTDSERISSIIDLYKDRIKVINIKRYRHIYPEILKIEHRNYAYYRLLIPLLEEVYYLDKVLYLDCDTVIKDNIEDLFKFDMQGYDCCACLDNYQRNKEILFKFLKKHNIECSFKNENYFNAGVILINLQNVRKWFDINLCRNIIKQQIENPYPLVDQDIINLNFKIKEISNIYNMWHPWSQDTKIFHPYGERSKKNTKYLEMIEDIKL